ncbi:MAG TPA: amidohydrolase family protein [Euzebyales bacterium]
MTGHDLVIRDARLRRGAGEPLRCDVRDIGITDGRITAISASETLDGRDVIDAAGDLVVPSFVDAHLHLDKVHTWRLAPAARAAYAGGGMGAAGSAIELASAVKDHYDESTIAACARGVLHEGLRCGVTHVRAFADTDTRAGLRGIRPLLALRDELHGVIDIQVVAFPQDGVVRDDGAAEVVEEAVRLGADLVGGIPWIEDTDAEARAHIDAMLDIAVRHDRDVAMLTDDAGDPGLRTTAMLAEAALDRGLVGRVTACHARALGIWPRPRLERMLRLAVRAGMGFVTNPHTAPLALPVTSMLDAGLPVALGQDDVADAYYPFGRHDLLEVALLAAHALDMTAPRDMERLLDMITSHPARVLRLDGHVPEVGGSADLVVLDGNDAHEVLRRHERPRHVLRAGHVVAASRRVTTSIPAAGETSPVGDPNPTTAQDPHAH